MKRVLALAVALAFIGAGCGGAATTTSPSAPPRTPEASTSPQPSATLDQTVALTKAVKAYSKACLTGNAKAAYLLLSSRVRARTDYASYKFIISQIEALYGDAEMTSLKVVDISGRMARVTYRYDISDIDQVREPWVLEGGEWRCDD